MRRAILALSLSILAILAWTGPASAAKRVALVIGIDAYDNLPALRKAVNDEKAVAAALADLGFEVVAGENLTRREMNAKLAELDAKIAPGDTVFFYFAGHGVALGAENYLLPRDLPKPRDGEENMVRDEGHAVDAIVRRVQSRGAAVSFFVLDACRDNPLAATGVRSIGGTRGLTRVDTPNGVFVLFSAGLGQTALDRLGDDDADPNSVFTRKLVPLLKTPGLTQVSLAKRVQREVDQLAASVRRSQQPAYYDQIIGEIELSPATAAAASAPALAAPQVAVVAPPAPVSPPKSVEPAVGVFPKPEPSAQYKPGDTFKDCDVCPEMVVVPAGTFTMGSPMSEKESKIIEHPQREVTVKSFAAGKFEVTKDQFLAFVGDSGHSAGSSCVTHENGEFSQRSPRSFHNPGYIPSGREPAVCLSWKDAATYTSWLSKKTGKTYRLLSEAEWEYAARAGTTSRYFAGIKETDLCRYANIRDRTAEQVLKELGPIGCTDNHLYTAPVGSFSPNAFGLHDMLGNASEWVEDCWHGDYLGAPSDEWAWVSGGDCSRRVFRGGAWVSGPEDLRLASRAPADIRNRRDAFTGFRVARTLTP